MTFWINQHLVSTKEAINQWRTNRNVNVTVIADHIEQGISHLVLGLDVGWQNKTAEPITVIEIQVIFYDRKTDAVLLRLLPLERFDRSKPGRAFEKKPLGEFALPPGEIHTEHIRFLSQENVELQPGSYTLDIQVRDTNHHSYTRRTKIELEGRIKYRTTEDWRVVTASP